jgi:hypothetical protein
MSNRLTRGEALVGSLTSDSGITADDLTATDDVVVGDDLDVTGDTRTGTLRVGAAGTVIKGVTYLGTAQIDFASIAAGAKGSGTFTVTGAAVGDIVVVQSIDGMSDLVFGYGTVTGANTVTVHVYNPTAGPIDNGPETFRYLWFDLT